MLRRACALALTLAACGEATGELDPRLVPQPLALEPYSPPQFTSRDIFLGGSGDVVVMAERYSRDGGATWAPLDASLGDVTRVVISGTTLMLHGSSVGLARWDVSTGAVTRVTNAPSYAGERTWRTEANGFLAFAPIENAIARESGGAWTTSMLPQPTATETQPFIQDVESNGTVRLAVSAWGVHRFAAGEWTLVTSSVPDAGRDLVVLRNGRFLLLGGATTYAFDAAGAAAGTKPGLVLEQGETQVCDDGAILARDQISRDAGTTWQPLLAGGDLTMIVERTGCGGTSTWVLARSEAWGYRLLRYDATRTTGVAAGNWEATGPSSWSNGGPTLARTGSGELLAAGLAWRDGDAGWHLRESPARTWAANDVVLGIREDQVLVSRDGGATWTARALIGAESASPALSGVAADEIEAFAVDATGALHLASFIGETTAAGDAWHARVWKSSDDGATWTAAYDAMATRAPGSDELVGEAHRFVGIDAAGTWIATDAVSHDGGATWLASDVDGDRSLAFIAPTGALVTTLPAVSAAEDVWRVYRDGGQGELVGTFDLEAEGQRIPASMLRSLVFDEAGYAYVARGAPYVQIWRTLEPIATVTPGM